MTLDRAKWRIAGIWLGGAGLVFLILVGQSLGGVYEPRTQDAWSWFLPTVMPTLSLMIGVLVADFRRHRPEDAEPRPVRPGLFWLAAGLSLVYLLLVALSILLQPLLSDTAPLDLMQRSSLWLGPLQGLTAGALAAFFA